MNFCLLNDAPQCKNSMLHNYNAYRLLNYFMLKSGEINEGELFLPQLYSVAATVDHNRKYYGFNDFYSLSGKI